MMSSPFVSGLPRTRAAVLAALILLLATPPAARAQPTLREGNSGPDVRLVQRLLNEENNAGLATDGAFGPRTEAAVIAFQRRFGLAADGIVGPNTWNRLILYTGGFSFPLAQRPSVDYHTGGRFFGAPRAGGRAHAACDLISPPGTRVLAIADGTITAGPYAFYQNTYAIEVTHPRGYKARYSEIGGTLPGGLRVGSAVQRGQHIATVIRNNDGTSMLHFELYKGTASGALTSSNGTFDYVPDRDYQRRRDLLNCTYWLDRWPNP